ncbi:hypothetical protein D0A40_14825 [Xanthomonas campestris pv. raphani]|nr:hypothetical protein D0A40_14825 [Xanthomonas campestris pv. raphani]
MERGDVGPGARDLGSWLGNRDRCFIGRQGIVGPMVSAAMPARAQLRRRIHLPKQGIALLAT